MGRLVVTLIEGKNLVARDLNGKSDPYVIVNCGAQTYKSKIINKNLNPYWNESFAFDIRDPQTERVNFQVFDKDYGLFSGADDPMGNVSVTIHNLVRGVPLDLWVPLQGVAHGQLHINILAQDFGQVPHQQPMQPMQPMQPYGYPAAAPQAQPMVYPNQPVYGGYPQQPMQPPQPSGIYPSLPQPQPMYQPQPAPQPVYYQPPPQPQPPVTSSTIVFVQTDGPQHHHHNHHNHNHAHNGGHHHHHRGGGGGHKIKLCHLRTHHRKYVVAENDGYTVNANRDHAREWETFQMILISGHHSHGAQVAFLTHKNKYLCAEPDGRVVGNRDQLGPWETWTVEVRGRHWAFRSHHGKYMCAEQDGRLVANRTACGPWESFEVDLL